MHFLDQPHRLVPLPHEPLPGGPASLQGHAPRHGDAVELGLLLLDEPEGGQVGAQPFEEAGLLLRVGHRHLDRAVEPDRSRLDPFQEADSTGKYEVVGQHRVAKLPPPQFDLLGTRDLGSSGEQRIAAHLQEVEPHRVVDPGRRLPWPRRGRRRPDRRRPGEGRLRQGR